MNNEIDIDRLKVLMSAAYDLLKKCEKSRYVLNAMEVTVNYDDAECDGFCLMEDIAIELKLGEYSDDS